MRWSEARRTAIRGALRRVRDTGFLACIALLLVTLTAAAQVLVINGSERTQCNENDNVYLKFYSVSVRRFTIEAAHPAYVRDLLADKTAPDFSHCDMSHDPAFRFEPRQLTLYDDGEWRLVGHTYPTFWRREEVPVHVGERLETGLHLVQLWYRAQNGWQESLVVYPSDGYWRARPLPPPNLAEAGYGSSFLIGPIDTQGRPFVAISEIAFDPPARRIRVAFVRGGEAVLHLAALDREHLTLDVAFDQPIIDRPFAALRSMFVSETSNDVAQVRWRRRAQAAWREKPVMQFRRAHASEFWAGRDTPSDHNTASPDMTFRDFTRHPSP